MSLSRYLAIDIGAGNGSRIALFDREFHQKGQTHFPRAAYGESFDAFGDGLKKKIDELLADHRVKITDIGGIGIASAGILGSDGRFILTNNLPQLIGHNVTTRLASEFGVPVKIENDANAGALAEWSILRVELLYWAFGGGWGGAWVSKDGNVRFPALDWDGDDATLDYSDEPGYSIPLEKTILEILFDEAEVSWVDFGAVMAESFKGAENMLVGPSGSDSSLRAERILSGPGRCRLFNTVKGKRQVPAGLLNEQEVFELADSAIAGKHISKLSGLGYEYALRTDRLWGEILGYAASILIGDARKKQLGPNAPVCLGGKPSAALPWFGPSAQASLTAAGFTNYMRPSVIDERGSSANLLGAAVVAWKASGDPDIE